MAAKGGLTNFNYWITDTTTKMILLFQMNESIFFGIFLFSAIFSFFVKVSRIFLFFAELTCMKLH